MREHNSIFVAHFMYLVNCLKVSLNRKLKYHVFHRLFPVAKAEAVLFFIVHALLHK